MFETRLNHVLDIIFKGSLVSTNLYPHSFQGRKWKWTPAIYPLYYHSWVLFYLSKLFLQSVYSHSNKKKSATHTAKASGTCSFQLKLHPQNGKKWCFWPQREFRDSEVISQPWPACHLNQVVPGYTPLKPLVLLSQIQNSAIICESLT